jgi:hypothetical protein
MGAMAPRSAGDLSLITRFEGACQEKPYKTLVGRDVMQRDMVLRDVVRRDVMRRGLTLVMSGRRPEG